VDSETLCELPPFQRIAYRLLTPLLTGAALLSALTLLLMNPLKDRDPEWMSHILFRLAVSGFMLGYMGWLSWRVSESYAWVKLGADGTLHMKSLWTGRITHRRVEEIAEVTQYLGGFRIRFTDGLRMSLEGHLGQGLNIEAQAGKWFSAVSKLHPN
jgi:hypothetical protein